MTAQLVVYRDTNRASGAEVRRQPSMIEIGRSSQEAEAFPSYVASEPRSDATQLGSGIDRGG